MKIRPRWPYIMENEKKFYSREEESGRSVEARDRVCGKKSQKQTLSGRDDTCNKMKGFRDKKLKIAASTDIEPDAEDAVANPK